eukprot:11276_1
MARGHPLPGKTFICILALVILSAYILITMLLFSPTSASIWSKVTIVTDDIPFNVSVPNQNVSLHPSSNSSNATTSFRNEWFRKYFERFDSKGHFHHQSLPSYYPLKSQKLFTKYIILSQLNKTYECAFEIRKEMIQHNAPFRHFNIGKTSHKYTVDWHSFYCETLLTLNGHLVWKINFFIIENSSILINKTVRDFEVRVNAFHVNQKHELLRSAGRVKDPIYDPTQIVWKYPAHF